MGSFTSLYFCRPTTPPRLTGADLANSLRDFADSGALWDRPTPRTFEIKFGDAIDRDANPSDWIEPVNAAIGATASIDWDIETHSPVADVTPTLEREHRAIYRANVDLGPASRELVSHMRRPPDDSGVEELVLDGWFMQIGPIRIDSRWDAMEFDCGWMAVSLGGPGGMYPSTPRGLVDKALNHEAVRKVMAICRERWPIEARPATPAAVEGRSLLRDQWCTGIYAPIDWFWTAK